MKNCRLPIKQLLPFFLYILSVNVYATTGPDSDTYGAPLACKESYGYQLHHDTFTSSLSWDKGEDQDIFKEETTTYDEVTFFRFQKNKTFIQKWIPFWSLKTDYKPCYSLWIRVVERTKPGSSGEKCVHALSTFGRNMVGMRQPPSSIFCWVKVIPEGECSENIQVLINPKVKKNEFFFAVCNGQGTTQEYELKKLSGLTGTVSSNHISSSLSQIYSFISEKCDDTIGLRNTKRLYVWGKIDILWAFIGWGLLEWFVICIEGLVFYFIIGGDRGMRKISYRLIQYMRSCSICFAIIIYIAWCLFQWIFIFGVQWWMFSKSGNIPIKAILSLTGLTPSISTFRASQYGGHPMVTQRKYIIGGLGICLLLSYFIYRGVQKNLRGGSFSCDCSNTLKVGDIVKVPRKTKRVNDR